MNHEPLSNETRADRARAALAGYADSNPYEDDESYPTDLLTDLMHLYGREEFNNALRMAEIHYEAELTGKD